MLRSGSFLGFALLLLGGCSRVPADVSTPREGSGDATAERGTKTKVSRECVAEELSICADSCWDSSCLEWCGGQACVATIASLTTCMDEAERRAASGEPYPKTVYETQSGAGEAYEIPTEESLARQREWEDARAQIFDSQWSSSCHALCVERLGPEANEPSRFCADWRRHYSSWAHLDSPTHAANKAADTAAAKMVGGMFAIDVGTTLRLTGDLSKQKADSRTDALYRMVSAFDRSLESAESCVAELGDEGQTFEFELEFSSAGEVRAAKVLATESNEAQCVATLVAEQLQLPVRVAREFPRIEVTVRVRQPFGGVMDVLSDTNPVDPSIFDDALLHDGYYPADVDNAGGGGVDATSRELD